MSKKVLSTACALFVVVTSLVSAAEPRPAMDGYCPVCLVKMNKLVKGDEKFSSVFDGQTYLFPSEKQQKMFERDPHRYVDADLALGGACPVCLVRSDKIVQGKPEYSSVYDGQRYLFPSPDQQRMFEAQPTAFVPAMQGNCTVCKVEKKKDVPGTAEYHLTHNGRLYLFPSQKQLSMFKANPNRYANADVAMDGYCSVCKVELGKNVRGNSEFAIDYNGKRYLFPGKKQLDMFKNNPTKYALN